LLHHHHFHHCDHCLAQGELTPDAARPRKLRLLAIAFVLISGFSAFELRVGQHSHSLALLADSSHMLSDSLALGLALLASWIASLPVSQQATFGYRRVEILAALVNGCGLLAIALWIGWSAVQRLQVPPTEILSLPMLWTAAIGLGVNSFTAWLLHRDSQHDLNLRAAFLHMVADALSAVGVLIAAIAVGQGWLWADGVVSLLVAILMSLGTWPLIRQSLNILLEQTPSHLNVAEITAALANYPEVAKVVTLKLWTVAPGQEILCAELQVTLKDGLARDRLLRQMQTQLKQEFQLQEVVLQMTLANPKAAIVTQLPSLSDQLIVPR
jgi:cobalt-zinc-cadmium efflux system protein